MGMNPEDCAAGRFKPIRQAREQIAKAEQAHGSARVRLTELQDRVGPAEQRDRERLGEALIAGKSEPASEAEQIRAEIVQQELRVEALRVATERARRGIPELVAENRDDWRGQAMRDLGKTKARYENAIGELEAARTALVDVATLVTWIDRGELGEAQNPAVNFPSLVSELRDDAEHLAREREAPDNRVPSIAIGLMRDGRAAMSAWARGGE
jgi:hypothetical protein